MEMEFNPKVSADESRVRVLIEKKTVLNLIDAYCVAVKHYLRGEEGMLFIHKGLHDVRFYVITGIGYRDLYHAARYLPPYDFPAGMPSQADLSGSLISPTSSSFRQQQVIQRRSADAARRGSLTGGGNQRDLPLPATTPGEVGTNAEKIEFLEPPKLQRPSSSDSKSVHSTSSKASVVDFDDLLPARIPPRYSLLDLFPFSLLVRFLVRRGRLISGKKATLLRAKLRHQSASHNLPLQISLYLVRFHYGADFPLSSMILSRARTLPRFKNANPSTLLQSVCALSNFKGNEINGSPRCPAGMLNALNSLIEALTGLERILTTPIPYSYVLEYAQICQILTAALRYSVHLWTVTVIYCFFLVCQPELTPTRFVY